MLTSFILQRQGNIIINLFDGIMEFYHIRNILKNNGCSIIAGNGKCEESIVY